MANPNNVPLKKFRKFLKNEGCSIILTTGGHEIYARRWLGYLSETQKEEFMQKSNSSDSSTK